jgi:putative two-component system response regulator
MPNNIKKTILAVDDMSLNLRTIKVTLERYFDVRLAKSGDLALAILGTTLVDLILLDIEMPGMSGFEALEQIREKTAAKNVPVIFVTSHVSTELISKALKCGAKDYIMKPFEPEVLIRKVHAVLNGVDVKHVMLATDGRCYIAPPDSGPAGGNPEEAK